MSLLGGGLSAAKCCGLIEAEMGIEQYAKLIELSAAKCCGLIEAFETVFLAFRSVLLSAAKCCGLIEAAIGTGGGHAAIVIIRS